jgi:predicted RNA binding protein YcfA (HicA-like mRNA interferase family)
MTRLPAVKPARVVRALERAGFVRRRVAGSHYQMTHVANPARRVTVPRHNRDLKRGTLHAIIKQSGLEFGAFLSLL